MFRTLETLILIYQTICILYFIEWYNLHETERAMNISDMWVRKCRKIATQIMNRVSFLLVHYSLSYSVWLRQSLKLRFGIKRFILIVGLVLKRNINSICDQELEKSQLNQRRVPEYTTYHTLDTTQCVPFNQKKKKKTKKKENKKHVTKIQR